MDMERLNIKMNKNNVNIIYPIHGDFLQTPDSHLGGKGCPRCHNKRAGILAIILNEIGVVHRKYRIKNRYFDYKPPDYYLINPKGWGAALF